MKLGERFLKKDLISAQKLKKALQLQQRLGGTFGDILLGFSNLRILDYYQLLAEHYNLDFIDLFLHPADTTLLTDLDHDIYLEKMAIPVHHEGEVVTIATSNPSPELFEFIYRHWGNNTRIVGTSRFDVLAVLQKRFKDNYIYEAINNLIDSNITLSAKATFNTWQIIFLIFVLGMSAYIAGSDFNLFFLGLNIFLTFTITGVLLYKLLLGMTVFFKKFKFHKPNLHLLPKKDLPIYTILIPLYKEKEVTLKVLFSSLNKMHYPKHKLDVKILLEYDDEPTITLLKQLKLPNYCEFIYVPPGGPRTKAKACNYGLKFARGEYLTLYDAEDKPDPYQLKIALYTFLNDKSGKLACVQSRLNFYNSNENWLTRMFTIEYSYWFDLLLPALENLHSPIPLGGTSNHFKTAILREIDAWDPYNVAEDADLGIRLVRLGYATKVIPTTTYEEANCRLGNWFKQRTRWIKGYMQTYIVHMRHPIKLLQALGIRGFLGFQLFLGGTILSNLSNIILWLIFIMFFIPPFNQMDFFSQSAKYLAYFNFVVGAFGMILLNLLGVWSRKRYSLTLSALSAPFYWLLISLASYRALYQLITNPSYWDKTEHGLSRVFNENYIDTIRK